LLRRGYGYRAVIVCDATDAKRAQTLRRRLLDYRQPGTGRERQPLSPIAVSDADSGPHTPATHAELDTIRRSGALIVLCSPAAARTRRIDDEVRCFQQQGRPHQIYCLILDGDPNAGGERECFPPALRELLGSSRDAYRAARRSGLRAPIAADTRRRKDGPQRAHMKLMAALLDVSVDSLQQRVQEREVRRLTQIGATIAGLFTIAILLALYGYHQRARNRIDQANAETLAEFVLQSAQRRTSDAHRPDLAVDVADRSLHYFTDRPQTALDDAERRRRVRATALIGAMNLRRGETDAARAAYEDALEGLDTLLAKLPDDATLARDRALALEALAGIAIDQRALDTAVQYADELRLFAGRRVVTPADSAASSDALHAAVRTDAEVAWLRGEVPAAMRQLESALALAEAAVERGGAGARQRLADDHGLAAAWSQRLGRLDAAQRHLGSQLALLQVSIAMSPERMDLIAERLMALRQEAALRGLRGDLDGARGSLDAARQQIAAVGPVAALAPAASGVAVDLATLLELAGHHAAAADALATARRDLERLDDSAKGSAEAEAARARLQVEEARSALRNGDDDAALRAVDPALDHALAAIDNGEGEVHLIRIRLWLVRGDAAAQRGVTDLAQTAWRQSLALTEPLPGDAQPICALRRTLRVQALDRLGEVAEARAERDALRQAGFDAGSHGGPPALSLPGAH